MMRGTEKQIAWAEEIRARLNGILDETLTRIDTEASAHPEQSDKAEAARAMVNGIADKINAYDGYAGEMIRIFKDDRDFRGIQVSLRMADYDHLFH